MAQNEIETGNLAPGDIDWVRPEVLSEEEFLRRWRQAQESQGNPVEAVEEIRRKAPTLSGLRGKILLTNETA